MKPGVVILVSVLILIFAIIMVCFPKDYYPQEGDWYCLELGIQINFGGGGECFALRDGRKMNCTWVNNRGSTSLYVLCQESECDSCRLGEMVLWVDFVSMRKNTLVVKDANSGTEYTFVKMN